MPTLSISMPQFGFRVSAGRAFRRRHTSAKRHPRRATFVPLWMAQGGHVCEIMAGQRTAG